MLLLLLLLLSVAAAAAAVSSSSSVTHRGRMMTTGRPSLSGKGDTNVLPVLASASMSAQQMEWGRYSRRLRV